MPSEAERDDTAPAESRKSAFEAFMAGASAYEAFGLKPGDDERAAGIHASESGHSQLPELPSLAPAALPGESLDAFKRRWDEEWSKYNKWAGLPDTATDAERSGSSDATAVGAGDGKAGSLYLAPGVKDCGEEFEEPWYEVRPCGCKSRFCRTCCVGLGLSLRERLIPRLKTFTGLMMVTLTLDPDLHASPQAAYTYCKDKRCVSEFVRTLRDGDKLHSPRWFCANEWQQSTEMIHFHLLLDASFIDFDVLCEAWNKFRPASAGPVVGFRPGFGSVRFSAPDFGDVRKAANYACKYVIKYPDYGFPDWVLDLKGQVHRYSTSRGFWGEPEKSHTTGPRAASIEAEARDKPHPHDCFCEVCRGEVEEVPDSDGRRCLRTTRQRLAVCRAKAVLLHAQEYERPGGELVTRRSFVASVGPGWQGFLRIVGRPDEGQRVEKVTAEMAKLLKSLEEPRWTSGRRGPRSAA